MNKVMYKKSELYIVHKTIDNMDEMFLCIKIIDCYRDIFTNCLFENGQFKSVDSISNYYVPMENNNGEYDLTYWFFKYNYIKEMHYRNYREINPLSDIDIYNHWYNLELLKKYNIKKLFLIKSDNSKQIHMCKYSIILKKFVDVFTLMEIETTINDSIMLLDDYLNLNNIVSKNLRLNLYSLLRLYNYINSKENSKLNHKSKYLSKLP